METIQEFGRIGRVCNLLLLLRLASAVPLGSESHRTPDHILLSQFFRFLQHGGPGPRIWRRKRMIGFDSRWRQQLSPLYTVETG
jgi:hypothetical protein